MPVARGGDNVALARLLEEIVQDRVVLAAVAAETSEVWDTYVRHQGDALTDRLGPPLPEVQEASAGLSPVPALAHLDRMTFSERLMFRPDGNPTPLVRFALFRADGQPCCPSRGIVLKKNGTPRPAFREGMRHRDVLL